MRFIAQLICIINKKAAERLNLNPPYLNQVIYRNGSNQPLVIKGVIENINTKSLTQEIIPNVYFRFNDQKHSAYQSGILLYQLLNLLPVKPLPLRLPRNRTSLYRKFQ